MSSPFAKSFYFYLEGVKVPFINASVGLSSGGFARCTVSIAYTSKLRELRTHTLGHIFFMDSNGKIRLLFAGELVSKGFSRTESSRTCQLSFLSLSANFAKTQIAIADNTPGNFEKSDANLFINENVIFMTGISAGAAPVSSVANDTMSKRYDIKNIPAVNNIIIESFAKAFGFKVPLGEDPSSVNYDYRAALDGSFTKYITPRFGLAANESNKAQNLAGSTSAYFSIANARFKLIDSIHGFTSLTLSDAFFTKRPNLASQLLLETGFEMLGADSVYSAVSSIMTRGFHVITDVIAPPFLENVTRRERVQQAEEKQVIDLSVDTGGTPVTEATTVTSYQKKNAKSDVINGRAFNMLDQYLKIKAPGVKFSSPRGNQTTGGKHSSSSLHYKGLARDYGQSDTDLSSVIFSLMPLVNGTNKGVIHEFFCNVNGHVALYLDGIPLESHPKANKIVNPGSGHNGKTFLQFIKDTHRDHLHVSITNTSLFVNLFPGEATEAPVTPAGSEAPHPAGFVFQESSPKTVIPSILFFPDLKSADPPVCNVFFPENYTNYSFSIQGEKVTRLISTQSVENSINRVVLTLQPIEFSDKSIDGDGTYKRNDFTSQEELEVGVSPQLFANRMSVVGPTNNTPSDVKNWYETTNPIRFFEFRYAGQQGSISMDFNPYPVAGLPAAIIDTELGHTRCRVSSINHNITPDGGTTDISLDCVISSGDAMEIKVTGIDLDSGFADALKNANDKKLDIFSPTGESEKPDDVYWSTIGARSACGITGIDSVSDALSELERSVNSNKLGVIGLTSRPIPTIEDLTLYYQGKEDPLSYGFSGPDMLPIKNLFISEESSLGVDTIVEKPDSPSTAESPKLKDRRKIAIAIAESLS
jgi:hypothetical protein